MELPLGGLKREGRDYGMGPGPMKRGADCVCVQRMHVCAYLSGQLHDMSPRAVVTVA